MAGTSNNAAKPEIIDLTKLSPEQLLQIRQEFEQVSASRVCRVGVSHNGSGGRAAQGGAMVPHSKMHTRVAHVTNNRNFLLNSIGDWKYSGLAVHFARMQSEICWLERGPRIVSAKLGEPANTCAADQQYVRTWSHKGPQQLCHWHRHRLLHRKGKGSYI